MLTPVQYISSARELLIQATSKITISNIRLSFYQMKVFHVKAPGGKLSLSLNLYGAFNILIPLKPGQWFVTPYIA